MFYQLMFVGLCAVPAIILPTAGSPLAEDFPKCNPGGLGYDGKFPVPEIEVTDHHTSVNTFWKPSSGKILESGPVFQRGNDDNLSIKPTVFPASIDDFISDCEKELSQSESWKATKEEFIHFNGESKVVERHAIEIFDNLKANKINPKELSDQHFKDYESIANFQTKIDVLKMLKLRKVALVNIKLKNSKLDALFSKKDFLVQLPDCPKWISPKIISLNGDETLQGFVDSLVDEIKEIILDCESEVSGFKDKGKDYELEKERYHFLSAFGEEYDSKMDFDFLIEDLFLEGTIICWEI
ncbi:hypothetical protein PGT21_035626 [Puccinia graminis f. sp. tritici]|uniref:Uncharacterized protein n=1 Tax=Puccinia graminis f. sp. tritici TaxID=56615 RepID=A0A5B0M9U8_PUCGR|nr:hypothetical protein PGTUg99_027195 [Puccinia graminis f. sp. tritici]KAA1084808.1 hypothetical protein PGT21_035626 [Puccinia graminis f. sp. tritici]